MVDAKRYTNTPIGDWTFSLKVTQAKRTKSKGIEDFNE